MRFAFTEDQIEFRDALRTLLRDTCPPEVVRRAWSCQPGELDRTVWHDMSEMGVLDVLVPVARGGLGLDWCSLVLLLEETGRVALPYPIVEAAAIAAPLVSTGSSLISASLGGSAAPCGADADSLLIDHEGDLVLVPIGGVLGTNLQPVDRARRLFSITAVDTSLGEVVVSGPRALGDALDRAVLGVAAQLLGLSQAMLDQAVSYVGERHQFGVPVGSFQAVKHMLADALKELSFARPVVYRAAWSLSVGDPQRSAHVSMAKLMASQAASVVGRAALQAHGAMGYAVEYDLHLFLKRAWALSRSYGAASWHRERVAAAAGIR